MVKNHENKSVINFREAKETIDGLMCMVRFQKHLYVHEKPTSRFGYANPKGDHH